MVIALWKVTAVLGTVCGMQGEKYVAWLQGSEVPVGFHYRNLISSV